MAPELAQVVSSCVYDKPNKVMYSMASFHWYIFDRSSCSSPSSTQRAPWIRFSELLKWYLT